MFKLLDRFLNETLRKKPLKKELINILYDLVKIYSPSGHELPVVNYSANLLKNSGFTVTVDEWNNVIAERGKYAPDDKLVCINAHTDTVQKKEDDIIQYVAFYDWIHDAFHTNNRAMIGGDDKCGVAVALTLAAHTDLPMKIVLTTGEEVGSSGAESLDQKVFDDVDFIFTVDRMHGRDLISEYCGLTCAPDTFVKKFIAMSESIGVKYEDTFGSYADTYILCQYAPAVNLSSGYYNPHSKSDFIKVEETYNTMRAIKNAIENKNDLVFAIFQAPKDWQKNYYAEFTEYAGIRGDFGYYGDVGHYGGGARSRARAARIGTMDYYGVSRKERRALRRKCKINYGKTRGFDDKDTRWHRLPDPDPDHKQSVDELIDSYADGEIYDEEWDNLLYDGVLSKVDYALGIDEKIARERYAAAFASSEDKSKWKEEEEEMEFRLALDDASTMPMDLEEGEYGRDELIEMGYRSGYLSGTVEDTIFVEYVAGQMTYQELVAYLNDKRIDRWFFDNCSRARQDFILRQMPAKPTRITRARGGKALSKRVELKSHGFISGYPLGSMEDDIFIDFVSGDMAISALWENVRGGLPNEVAQMFIDAKQDYEDALEEDYKDALEEEDRKRFEKERMFLYNKQRSMAEPALTARDYREQKRVKKLIRKSVRNGEKIRISKEEYDDSTGCGN